MDLDLLRAPAAPAWETVAGKSVLVTGGTSGIGRAVASLLVARGARVFIFGLEEQKLSETLREIREIGYGEVYGMVADVTRAEDVRRVFEEVDGRLDGLDILVNNAAIGGGSVADTEWDAIERVIQTNFTGYLLCCKEAIRRMRLTGDGYIVNIGSMSTKARGAGSDLYVATKAGVEGFTDTLAKLANQAGVRMTLIEPGLVGSDMTMGQVSEEEQQRMLDAQEMIRAEDIAECVHYCLTQPKRVNISLVHIRPTRQVI